MLKFPNRQTAIGVLFCGLIGFQPLTVEAAGNADEGENVFKKCRACHAVGDNAKNKVGPHLNDVFGRAAGSIDGFRYSKAMVAAGEGGLVWNEETLGAYLADPRGYIEKTKMAFAGLKKDQDVENVLAYLRQFAAGSEAKAVKASAESSSVASSAVSPSSTEVAVSVDAPASTGAFGLGRQALPAEITAWDIDVRPDGQGLPKGRGKVSDGEVLYTERCAMCHGDFGEGVDRWPVLAGGHDTLTEDRPEKTIGSYWPYLSTVFDYVRRAMPFGDARSLSDDDVYAITAYILYLNDIVLEEDFVLSDENFLEKRLPNEENFIPDNRMEEAHYNAKFEPCMTNCTDGPVSISMRARVLDVTPESDQEGGSGID
jgi:cytochrome c2